MKSLYESIILESNELEDQELYNKIKNYLWDYQNGPIRFVEYMQGDKGQNGKFEDTVKIRQKGSDVIVDVIKNSVLITEEYSNKPVTDITGGGMFRWGNVVGSFWIDGCKKIKSLEGAPEEVGGNFLLRNLDSLTSLKGMPKKVGMDSLHNSISIQTCNNLKNYMGLPSEIPGGLHIENVDSVNNLRGLPNKIGGELKLWNNDGKIKSLIGGPKEVKGELKIYISSLESLEGMPTVNGPITLSGNENLKSLAGCPALVNGDFNILGCTSLTSLEGAPETINGNFICSGCTSLTSLENGPKQVNGNFICSDCGTKFKRS